MSPETILAFVLVLLILTVICMCGLVVLVIRLYWQKSQMQSLMDNRVQARFQIWLERECESIRGQEREIALREAKQWMNESEASIRSDAIQRSQSVIIGKVTEHLVPYMPKFGFNPKDVRFVGSPIDLVIFDGMNEENIQNIIFVEVKTGASASLTKRERQIRDAIEEHKVRWLELRIDRETPAGANVVTDNPAAL